MYGDASVTETRYRKVSVFFWLFVIKPIPFRYAVEIKKKNIMDKYDKMESANKGLLLTLWLKECRKIDKKMAALKRDSLSLIKQIVDAYGRIEFDWENGDAPSIVSMQFGEDVADCHVKALYMDGDTLYADLHAYYLDDDMDGVDLANDEIVDWCSLLQEIYSAFDKKAE